MNSWSCTQVNFGFRFRSVQADVEQKKKEADKAIEAQSAAEQQAVSDMKHLEDWYNAVTDKLFHGINVEINEDVLALLREEADIDDEIKDVAQKIEQADEQFAQEQNELANLEDEIKNRQVLNEELKKLEVELNVKKENVAKLKVVVGEKRRLRQERRRLRGVNRGQGPRNQGQRMEMDHQDIEQADQPEKEMTATAEQEAEELVAVTSEQEHFNEQDRMNITVEQDRMNVTVEQDRMNVTVGQIHMNATTEQERMDVTSEQECMNVTAPNLNVTNANLLGPAAQSTPMVMSSLFKPSLKGLVDTAQMNKMMLSSSVHQQPAESPISYKQLNSYKYPGNSSVPKRSQPAAPPTPAVFSPPKRGEVRPSQSVATVQSPRFCNPKTHVNPSPHGPRAASCGSPAPSTHASPAPSLTECISPRGVLKSPIMDLHENEMRSARKSQEKAGGSKPTSSSSFGPFAGSGFSFMKNFSQENDGGEESNGNFGLGSFGSNSKPSGSGGFGGFSF